MLNKKISASSSGDNEIIAAPGANLFIRVYGYVMVAAGAVSAKFTSKPASGAQTDLTGAMPFAANGGAAPGHSEAGWFDCAENEALNLNLSGAVLVAGHVEYDVMNS